MNNLSKTMKSIQSFKQVLLVISLVLLFGGAQGAARYWIATTTSTWNSTANWSTSSGGSGGASVPVTSDDVYFNSAKNGNCTIDATVSINGMDIGGYTGTITNTTYSFTVSANNYFTQSSGTFNGGTSAITVNLRLSISGGTFNCGSGTVDINGTGFYLSGGTFIATSGIMYVTNYWNHSAGTFTHNSGTVVLDGSDSPNNTIPSGLETFYNLKIDKSGGAYVWIITTNDKFLITGTLTLSQGNVIASNSVFLEAQGPVTVLSTFGTVSQTVRLKFSGTANQDFDLTNATNKIDVDVEINKSSGQVNLISDLTMDASKSLYLTSGTLNLNSYTLSNTSGATYCTGIFTISGTGTLDNYGWFQTSGSPALTLSGASTFKIGTGHFTQSTGTFSAGSATLDFNGHLQFTGGTFTGTSGIMYLYGNWSHSTSGTFNHNNGTVYFDGAVDAFTNRIQIVGNTETFYNLTFNLTSGTKILYTLNDNLIVLGTLTFSGGFVSPGNGGDAVSIEARGDVSVGSSFGTSSNDVSLNFTGSTSIQTFTFTGTTTRINGNITVNKTSGKVNLGSGVTVFTSNALTVTAGTLNCLNQVVSGPTFSLASGATLEMGSTGGIASSGASGNIQTTTRTFNTGSYYVYSGISGAQVTGTGLPSTIAGLTINNSSGVTLTASETINTLFTLTSGNLTLGTFNIVMASGSSLSGGSSSSFVYTGSTGFLKFNSCAASSSKTFPVGHTNSSAGYVPLVMTFNGGHTTDDFNVIAVDKVTTNGSRTGGSDYTSTVVKAMWFVTETTTGGSNVTMQFQWNGTDEASGFVRSSCYMSHYTNSSWENPGSNASASGSNPYTFTYSNYTGTFSPFGMGGSGGPLPVKLLYFKAKNQNGTGHISWATAAEINNDYFTIEKSTDGKNFETIGKITGAGNSQQILKYAFMDSNLTNGINYYRLKQTDYNGEVSYSDIKIISDYRENENKIKLSLYPVPASDFINVELNNKVDLETRIRILNILGTTVSEKNITLQSGYNHVEMDINNLQEGVYFIQIQGLENYQSTSFLIQR